MRACERSEAERVRCVVEAAPLARPGDHLGCIFCSSFVAEYHLGLTSALQPCQHNGAFRFLAAQVRGGSLQDFIRFWVILRPVYISFLSSRDWFHFFRACFQVIFLSISEYKFRRRKECIAKVDYSWKPFLMNFGIGFCCFC